MASTDVFKFDSPDLVNLGKWYKRAPREFTRAATNVVNKVAFKARRRAISVIGKNTTTRNKKFVSRSMRVTTARHGQPLNSIVATMGSVDISRQGRSTGFEELETGILSRNKRVPVMAARGNQESKQVGRPVRANQIRNAFRPSMFRGKGSRSRKAQVARMLAAVRGGAIGNKPFLVPRGIRTKVGKMPAGLWRKGKGRLLVFMNPTVKNVDKRTKAIHWMDKSIEWATSDANIKKIWVKETNRILKMRR